MASSSSHPCASGTSTLDMGFSLRDAFSDDLFYDLWPSMVNPLSKVRAS